MTTIWLDSHRVASLRLALRAIEARRASDHRASTAAARVIGLQFRAKDTPPLGLSAMSKQISFRDANG